MTTHETYLSIVLSIVLSMFLSIIQKSPFTLHFFHNFYNSALNSLDYHKQNMKLSEYRPIKNEELDIKMSAILSPAVEAGVM